MESRYFTRESPGNFLNLGQWIQCYFTNSVFNSTWWQAETVVVVSATDALNASVSWSSLQLNFQMSKIVMLQVLERAVVIVVLCLNWEVVFSCSICTLWNWRLYKFIEKAQNKSIFFLFWEENENNSLANPAWKARPGSVCWINT